jgi:hypothetical protein
MASMPNKFTSDAWPIRHDRELIMLAKTHTVESLAEKFNLPMSTILQRAERLGLSIRGKAKRK